MYGRSSVTITFGPYTANEGMPEKDGSFITAAAPPAVSEMEDGDV
jgi:hypothetical protein